MGRSARDNDTLSIRIARGSDTWLHTADVPGSHVVLRTPKGQEPDGEEVLDAAHLAIHFTGQGTDRAPVHVVAAKHDKPKGPNRPRGPLGRPDLGGSDATRSPRGSTAREPARLIPKPCPTAPPMKRPSLSIALLRRRRPLAPVPRPARPRSSTGSPTRSCSASTSRTLYYVELNDWDRVLDQATRGLELDPTNQRFQLMFGRAHLMRGDRDSIQMAIDMFEQMDNRTTSASR